MQRPPDDDETLKQDVKQSVMAVKSIDPTNKIFVTVEDDISFVKFKSVLGILPIPKIIMHGDRVRYEFMKKVNVFEN